MPEPPPEPPSAQPRRPWRRALLLALASSLVAAAGAELGFRWLLFGEGELARRWGAPLRVPGYYADPDADGDYWKLQRIWSPPERRPAFAKRDALVGWHTPLILPDLDHDARRHLKGRRPMLMYGDSFTACTLPLRDCWQGLMHRSELARDWCIINYGVHAYGLDQIYLLMRESLARWEGEDALVVVGILVDNDLDRTLLDFRGCPKPVLSLVGDGLQVRPAGLDDIDAWLAENPPSAASWVFRYLTRRRSVLPDALLHPRGDHPELVRRKTELCRRILEALKAELEARDVDYFLVLFHGEEAAAAEPPWTWREALLQRTLTELDMPWVSSRAALRAHQRESGLELDEYFLSGPPFGGHYNELGNAAVFPAIARGLRGEFDGPAPPGLAR